MRAFREKVERESVRELFTTVDDLEKKLLASLVDWTASHDPAARPAGVPTEKAPITTPPPPALLIGREPEMQQIRRRLTSLNGGHPTVILGWPGVGKTTFVTALAHDRELREAFTDGVLWAALGEEADPLAELGKWARTLGAGIRPGEGLDNAMAQLRGLLHDKRALLIVDDVWHADAAQPFRVGGPECRAIFTTRFGDVAAGVATTSDDIVVLDRLSDEDGVRLLWELTPRVVDSHAEACRRLVADLEGLPLALRVAGRLLERDAAAGFDVDATFQSIGSSATILRETAPDDRFDPGPAPHPRSTCCCARVPIVSSPKRVATSRS